MKININIDTYNQSINFSDIKESINETIDYIISKDFDFNKINNIDISYNAKTKCPDEGYGVIRIDINISKKIENEDK